MRAANHETRTVQKIAALLACSTAASTALAAATVLPTPCVGTACSTSAAQWVTAGAATLTAAQNALTIKQTSNTAILNWSSFNIGAGGKVTYQQPGSSSIALNRIFQASPSQIFGQLSANGQIYLINLNGFIFGATSTVNVGSLLVSSLPLSLTDATFANGILSPLQNDQALFNANLDPLAPGVGRTSVLDQNGNPVLDANGKPIPVQVVVQPGAQITAADQGRVFLTGQSVTNGGAITAPDGQIILAAGSQIYVQADSDPSLRGLIVEVDGTSSNSALNQVTGALSAARGNITMVGLAVNQDGRISATTSVAANGSIRLEAAGGASNGIAGGLGDQTVSSTVGGSLTIGPQSQMQILTDTSAGTAVSDQTQYSSSITLLGEQVILQGGSIVAPSANLTAVAAANPAGGVTATPDPNARLRIDPGTSIDLQGSTASLPVTANLVSAQLRSSELADDPTQRNGALHGLTVYVNALDGSPPIANLSGELASVPQTIAQRTESGGNATFESEGDAVFASGASINVSGGSSTYAGGVLQTSYLVGANGQLYPIETANPLLTYVGVVNPTFTQTYNSWGVQNVVPTPGLSSYQPGYVEGAPAGKVQFAAATLVLQGTLQGNATNGVYQRTPSTAVSGGELTIGIPGGIQESGPTNFLSPAISLTTSPAPIVVADDASLSGPLTLELPTAYLTSSGFTSTAIYSNYNVTLPANTPLSLPDGSSLAVNATRVDVLSSITDPGGSLAFQNVATLSVSSTAGTGERPGVYIGDGVTLDVDGLWTNDEVNAYKGAVPTAQTWQNGGSISLGTTTQGALLSIGNDVSLLANGGAWLEAGSTVVAGTGGAITLNEGAVDGGFDVGSNLAVAAFGVNGSAGGTFNLTVPRIAIASGSGDWTGAQQVDDTTAPGGVLQIGSSLFSNYGFQSVALTANGLVVAGAPNTDVLTVDAGTNVSAVVQTQLLGPGYSMRPSAATLDDIAPVTVRQPYLRTAENISLSALPNPAGSQTAQTGTAVGDVLVGIGASMTTDPGGQMSLTSLGSIVEDGVLRAPGGTVSLHIDSPAAGYSNFDVGYLPTQGIVVGSSAVIDASGTFVAKPSTAGLSAGTLDAGGTVDLFADRGTIVAEPGSLISIAGVSAGIDVLQRDGTYSDQIEASAGGTLSVRSGEAISLLGNLEAAGGAGGTTGAAAAGALDIVFSRSESWWGVTTQGLADTFAQGPLTVELESTNPSSVPPSLPQSNAMLLGAAQLGHAGFDALSIETGVLVLSGNYTLNLGRELVLNAPVIEANVGAHASLSAPFLAIENELFDGATPANHNTPQNGSGVLSFSGGGLELVGNTVFQGTSDLTITSSGDLQLIGLENGASSTQLLGSLTLDGNLALNAARIYPATATSFTIDAAENPSSGIPGTVTILQQGTNPGTPLSADGTITIDAFTIASNGTLYAPFGTITLDATNALTLGPGSLTSVSGAGLTFPYGSTEYGGEEWTYAPSSIPEQVTGIPARQISLTAPNVTLGKGATVDLAGGGDLSAYEWVPGPGGSTDALAPGATPGLYAILPGTRGELAPSDPQLNDSSLGPAASVYWSGGGGLAAGTYPLLPARYALEPGAFLIQVESSFESATPGTLGTLANGTPVIAGFLTSGTTGLHEQPGYTGFAIYPGSYGNQLAAYTTSLASTFFPAAAAAAGAPAPVVPADAGTLSIAVTNSLNAAGQVLSSAASGGLAATIEISSSDLVVGSATGTLPADAVSVSGTVLASWQPGTLVLGGTLTPTSTVTTTPGLAGTVVSEATSDVDVLANTVTVGAGTSLTAAQIIVVANDAIDVQAGATLQSTSGSAGTAPKTVPVPQAVVLSGSTNPGFLAVSDLGWLIPVRAANSSATGAATVAIDPGATIASRGSLTVDGTGGVTLAGTLTGPGAEWALGSSSIAFVPNGVSADALAIGPALSAQLDDAGAVRLASTGSIDLLTPVTLGVNATGSPTLTSLTLQAASLNNLTGSGGVAGATASAFGAKDLVLDGVGGSPTGALAGPTGASLTLAADELDFGSGSGTLTINGFAATKAAVGGAVIGEGAGALGVGGDLAVATTGITAAAASNAALGSTGSLSVTGTTGTAVPQLLGGALTLSGSDLNVAGTVTAPGGAVNLLAANTLTIAPGADVAAAGAVVNIENQTSAAPGGTITASAGGNLVVAGGATLNVSGAGSAAAGAIDLAAGGSASIAGTLKGGAASGAGGGSFSLQAGSLVAADGGDDNPLTALAAALGGTGGFSDAIAVRVETGGLTLARGSTLTANSVTLTADSGSIVVDGTIAAPSGALRGSLELFGGTGVTLAPGAALHADGSGAGGLGGAIEIGAGQLVADSAGVLDAYDDAVITLLPGSTISTAGAGGDGTLLLRAPALLASNSIGIAPIGATLNSVGEVIVEPVLPFNTTSFSSATAPTAGDFANVGAAVQTFMNAAGANILARVGGTGATPLVVEAGVEIIAPGGLTLPSSGLDLSSYGLNWQFNGQPVDLTVRAAGSIEVAGSISDGFYDQQVGDDGSGVMQPTLLSGPSATLRLVAGADLTSANPLSVVADPNGAQALDLTLDPGVVVRTGTGNIDLVAARNIVLAGAGSGAYTAGTPAISPGGTAAIPYPSVDPNNGTTSPSYDNDNDGEQNDFGIFVPGTSVLMSFPTGGGNLLVRAGGSILNESSTAPGGVTDWQVREGGTTYDSSVTGDKEATPVEWGVNLLAYDWNFGTLGGGDVSVSAGGQISNVSVASADSLLPQAAGATPVYVTSGGLAVAAGGNIGSPQIFLADGTGSVISGGALTATLPGQANSDVGAAFYLQTSAIDVTARLGITVDAALDPTALYQPKPAGFFSVPQPLQGQFFTYGDDAALELTSVAGDVDLGTAQATALQTLLGSALSAANAGGGFDAVMPPTLVAAALSGSIDFSPAFGSRALYGSPTGQLDLLAAQNIVGNGDSVGRLIMYDAPAGSEPTVANPLAQGAGSLSAFGGDLHVGDPNPALVTAGGDIEQLSLSIPKPVEIIAGGNITDLTLAGQNLSDTDTTIISAGQNIEYSNTYSGNGISIGGPGTVDMLAGDNISLGFSSGVVTTGNLLNANLPTSQGANLTMVTGLGTSPDVGDFLTKIVAPSAGYVSELENYVESLQGGTGLTLPAAEADFEKLTTAEQLPFLDSVFFNELSLSGLAETTIPGAGFTEGYAAINALFPGSNDNAGAVPVAGAYAGDLTLQFSRIYTLSGGNITLVVPGGGIDVGLANPPSTLGTRPASTLGIVTEGPGNIDIYSQGDVNVNSSRIFTLGGGNILIWSNEGSIDAGLGAKTSVSAPPPTILINSNGTVTLDFSGAAEGSGIRTIQTQPTTPPGDVNLIAPVGTVNAGDAGIGSSGNINIAARSVLGVSNISFGGTATGVPAQVSSVSASLSGASSAGSGATTTASSSVTSEAASKEQAAPLAQNALSWLDVFITGLGEENCKQDDIECLKRQKKPTP